MEYSLIWNETETEERVYCLKFPAKDDKDIQDYFRITVSPNNGQTLSQIPIGDESSPNFEILDSNISSIDGSKSREVLYQHTSVVGSVERQIKALKVITIYNNTQYLIAYYAQLKDFDEYLPTVKYMIESL